jgi:hypothetical protein
MNMPNGSHVVLLQWLIALELVLLTLFRDYLLQSCSHAPINIYTGILIPLWLLPRQEVQSPPRLLALPFF